MYWRDVATLVKVEKTVDSEGYKTETTARREIFVNKKSATRRRQDRPRAGSSGR